MGLEICARPTVTELRYCSPAVEGSGGECRRVVETEMTSEWKVMEDREVTHQSTWGINVGATVKRKSRRAGKRGGV